MEQASPTYPPDPWAEERALPRWRRRAGRPRRFLWRRGRRIHRLRRYRRPPRARDRVRSRRRHQQRVRVALKLFGVPVLALVPASLWFIAYPLNLVIAPALGVMGLVLMFGRTH